MAKGKKGKQKQETTQLPPSEAPSIITKPPEEPPKTEDGDAGLMEMAQMDDIGFHDDPLPSKAAASPSLWPVGSPALGGWGNDPHTMKPTSGAKGSSASKAAAATGDPSAGWGGGSVTGGGNSAGHRDPGAWGRGEYEEEEWEGDEEEEWEEEAEYGWGAQTTGDSWGVPAPATAQARTSTAPAQPGWKGWSEEAKRLSKVTSSSIPMGYGGGANKTVPSPQQQSQILNSLLSQPQSQNSYGAAAQQQQRQRQTPAANPYPQQFQRQNPLPHVTAPAQPQHQELSKKEKKRLQKEQEQLQAQLNMGKHRRSQSENFDPWGAGGSSGSVWGADSGGWGAESGGWGANHDPGWGPIMEEDESYYEEDDRRVHFSPRSNAAGWGGSLKTTAPSFKGSESIKISNPWGSDKPKDTTYTMPSKTLTHAINGTTTSLNTGIPRNKINEYTNVQFHESRGAALAPFSNALFGGARKAKDRIHWMFPPDKDDRVQAVLTWIESVSYSLGTYGLHMFLQSRERGALITNADYRPPDGKNEPAFDWLTFDELQNTRDKILQESVAFYDPAVKVIVFVFLPSPSGNSVAMWRRKINVPNNMRLMLQAELSLALAALRREEDYLVHVDEYPKSHPSYRPNHPEHSNSFRTRPRRASLPSRTEYPDAYPILIDETREGKPKKKKRKWWQFFRVDW